MNRILHLLNGKGAALLYSGTSRRAFHCARCLRKSAAEEMDLEETSPGTEEEVAGSLNRAYTEEEADSILHVLNTAPESELAAIRLLRGKKSSTLVQYRQQYGPFLDLDSVVKVPYFKHKITMKVFDSILNPADRDTRKERKSDSRSTARFIKPDLPAERLENAESIVSIVFGIKKIAWAHVDRTMTVLDWQQEEWHRFMKGTYFAHVYLEDVAAVVSTLPAADLYVLEKPGVSMQNSTLFPVALHLRTVEAMLYAMLNAQYTVEEEHRVFSMNRSTVGKYFELMVGESRTSGLDIARRLLTDSIDQEAPRVRFPRDMIFRYRNHFQTRGQNRNEELSDALLQAIAFYELAVL